MRTANVGGVATKVPAGWCRLIVFGTASRRHRCRTQRRWRAVQRVTFEGVCMEVPMRRRVAAAAPERRMVGQALDLVAVEERHEVSIAGVGTRNVVDLAHARVAIATAKDSHDGWSEKEAEDYVRGLLGDHRLVSRFKQATRSWAEEEARKRGGWKGAAAYFIERGRAAIARRGDLSGVLLERAALAKCGGMSEVWLEAAGV